MQKITITSNSHIIQPQSLKNIDISLGISYFCTKDKDVKIINNQRSYNMIGKIAMFAQNFVKDFFNNKEIIESILENSQFVLNEQSDNAKNLHIQINQDDITAKAINFVTAFNIIKKINYLDKEHRQKSRQYLDDILSSVDSNAAYILSDTKKMFLGTKLFKENNRLYKKLVEKMAKHEIVSLIFFHEYSHSSELMNNSKYGKEQTKTNTSFDYINSNLILLSDSAKIVELINNCEEKNMLCIPHEKVIKTLQTLHKEIYADVGALLLMRNKGIINGTYEEKKFEQLVNHMVQVRKKEKEEINAYYNKKNMNTFMTHDHFTSPGIEQLLIELKKITNNGAKKVLTEKEIHHVSDSCVQQGIAKTILAIIKADNTYIPQLKTLFSLRCKHGVISLDKSKNHYLEAMNKIKEIVSKDWQVNVDKNIRSMSMYSQNNNSREMIFNAALDNETFQQQLITLQKNNKENTMEEITKITNSQEVQKKIIKIRNKIINIVNVTKKSIKNEK